MSQNTIARILSISETQQVIIPMQQALELQDTPEYDAVPGLVGSCLGLMHWQNTRIPLVDIESYISGQKAVPKKYVLVVRYHDSEKQVKYAGITCHDIPESVSVTNEDACTLPTLNQQNWQNIAPACVHINENPTPIIAVKKLFN